jgi:hypothetical protein
MKKKIIYIIYFGCVLFFLLFFIIIQILKNPVINEYSNIDEKLHNLNLNQFNYYRTEEEKRSSDYIYMSFHLKDFDKFDINECTNDINNIKENINECISDEKYGLYNKFIRVMIHVRPGEMVYIYNYNFLKDQKDQEPEKLLYYEYLFVDNLSSLNYFNDCYVLNVSVSNIDNINIFENFYNIEYLNISGPLTENDKQQLLIILTDCTVICNGEIVSK